VSLFVVSPEIEDRNAVEVGNWAKHKKTFYSEWYLLFYLQADHKNYLCIYIGYYFLSVIDTNRCITHWTTALQMEKLFCCFIFFWQFVISQEMGKRDWLCIKSQLRGRISVSFYVHICKNNTVPSNIFSGPFCLLVWKDLPNCLYMFNFYHLCTCWITNICDIPTSFVCTYIKRSKNKSSGGASRHFHSSIRTE
jgi:hypothetical protein